MRHAPLPSALRGVPWAPRRSVTAAAVLVGIATLAACGSSGATSTGGDAAPASSPVASSPAASAATGAVGTGSTSAGTVLVDAQGRTLYAFAADPVGRSTCTGSCATYWPPEPAGGAAGTHPAGVTATLGAITRADGTSQLTVDGHPVYRYRGDSAAGQANGQGLTASGGLWWVVRPDGSWITSTTAGSPSAPAPSASGRAY